jgi:hypothetical protein
METTQAKVVVGSDELASAGRLLEPAADVPRSEPLRLADPSERLEFADASGVVAGPELLHAAEANTNHDAANLICPFIDRSSPEPELRQGCGP